MKSILFGTLLLTLLISSSTQASEPTFTGSLDCSFIKNNTKKISLTATMGDDYEEEATEIYTGNDGEVKAEVLYLPFQYGIIVSLNYKNVENAAGGEAQAGVDLNVDGDLYSLTCKE